MKTAIEVVDKAEGARIVAAITDPVTRTALNVIGFMLPLSSSDRLSVLMLVADRLGPDALAATASLILGADTDTDTDTGASNGNGGHYPDDGADAAQDRDALDR